MRSVVTSYNSSNRSFLTAIVMPMANHLPLKIASRERPKVILDGLSKSLIQAREGVVHQINLPAFSATLSHTCFW